MTLDWMNVYLSTLQSHPQWLMALIFVVAFTEALALVGVVVPGIVLLFALSLAIGLDDTLFLWAWASAALGALMGDGLSFAIGRRWQPRSQSELLTRAQAFFQQHGGKSILMGRFIGPLRPVMPLMGGMLGMRWPVFWAFAIPACVAWAPVYLLPGMIFGASLEMATQMAGRLAVLMVVLVMGTWFCLWLVRLVYGFTTARSRWWLKRWVQWSHRHPILGRWVGDLMRPGSREVIAIAFLGLIFAFSLSALIALLIAAPALWPDWPQGFHPATWASSLRNEWADSLMVALAIGGDLRVVGTLVAMMAVVMWLSRRYQAAGHWVVACGGVWLVAMAINGLMRWWVDLPSLEAAPHASLQQSPHIAFAVTMTAAGFFALMVVKDLTARLRKWPYWIATLVVVLVGFAQIYLELASPLGLVTAVMLALGWMALVGIGYRHRTRVSTFPLRLVVIFMVVWITLWGFGVHRFGEVLLNDSRLVVSETVMSESEYQEAGWSRLPMRRSVVGPESAQWFDFQWVGSLDDWEATLSAQGWTVVERLSWPAFIEAMSGEPPIWPRAFNGRQETLIMRYDDPTTERVMVVRLWSSGVRVSTPGAPSKSRRVWLGQLSEAQATRGFFNLGSWVDVEGDGAWSALEESLSGEQRASLRRLSPEPTLLTPQGVR